MAMKIPVRQSVNFSNSQNEDNLIRFNKVKNLFKNLSEEVKSKSIELAVQNFSIVQASDNLETAEPNLDKPTMLLFSLVDTQRTQPFYHALNPLLRLEYDKSGKISISSKTSTNITSGVRINIGNVSELQQDQIQGKLKSEFENFLERSFENNPNQ